MRYTLRLLTLDQLGRAAGLVCALELEREADTSRYGKWPIEIGLWVGKAATPNLMGRKGDSRSDTARSKTRQFKSDPGKAMPIPLESCPWCGTRFEPASFTLLPDDQPSELRIVCTNFECDFSGDRPLPILAVDEPIYRRLPAFLIATVDKFASLPFTGQTGALLGGAGRFDSTGFYGASEPRRGRPLEQPLAGPDLVIQDELHLISGPLGTMVGLYETTIEALCVQAAKHPADVSEDAAARTVWQQDRRRQRPFPGGPYILLHTLAHLLIQSMSMRCGYPASSIDDEAVFITSANLTAAALDRNIEIGLLTRDRTLATSVSTHFRGLIDTRLLSPLPQR